MSSLFDFENKTDRYTVMGNPINHSKSPLIHTLFSEQTKQNIEYTATQVDPGGFEQAVGNFQASGGKGLNITVPFKQEAWHLSNERSARAEIAGAVNTILFKSGGIIYGDNTDGIGLVKDIRENHNGTFENQRVLILGAGGAVRGVLLPILEQKPKQIIIANRTTDKAKALAKLYGNAGDIRGSSYQDVNGLQFDLIINGTSASLNAQLPPLPNNILADNAWCYDMMYAKEPSLFLHWAIQQKAVKAIDGLGMLVEQAAESFYLWRGKRPDTTAVIEKLRIEM
ncbi:MAG: shikimate dehydrogenase [Gammaproteobacteria bacterium]|nr:shikimate dehydrogenase [Gammaproteobacteria bacterium]